VAAQLFGGEKMKEIRIHGRGGQGSVVTAELLAIAAFESGKYSLAFPFLGGGGERRGAPVQTFVRLDDNPIRLRSQVVEPDYVVLQDWSLMEIVDVTLGIKENGILLVNTEKSAQELNVAAKNNIRIKTVPASKIALEILGMSITNSAIMGAFAAITNEINIESIARALADKFSGSIAEKNIAVARAAYKYALEQH
jgi:pyruvate ferredoxin oxidoreductase gamma subunit